MSAASGMPASSGPPSPFVLVHGAFRGGWAWRRVRPALVAAGHDAYAPSLVGMGERIGEIARATSLDVWLDDLEALLVAEDLRDVVLVGHSQGGIVTTALAARVPERLRAVVHLDAAVPAPGERAIDLGPGGFPTPVRSATVAPRPPEPDEWLDAATVAWMTPRLTPTPVGPSLDPVPAPGPEVVQHFWFCTGTPAGYPSRHTRARLDAAGVPYGLLETGHDAPLCAPGLVSSLLLDAAVRA